jgi:hypothetical protein
VAGRPDHQAKTLTKDEVRRIARNIARLLEPLGKGERDWTGVRVVNSASQEGKPWPTRSTSNGSCKVCRSGTNGELLNGSGKVSGSGTSDAD